MKDAGTDQRCAGNSEDPSPNDAPGDAPAHGGQAARGSDADNGAGDGVRGADGNAEVRGARERKRARSFRGESAKRRELGDALSHRFDDAPTAGHGATAHGQMAADDDPIGHIEGRDQATRGERSGDDTHAFLRVVGAVAKAVSSGGEQLQAAKPAIYF